jgi:nucleotide-binding universal stress UspA family protein
MAMAHGNEARPRSSVAKRDDPAEPVIVVGLDGSPTSWDAFCWAVGEAARRDARVIAVYVIPITDVGCVFGVPFDYTNIERAKQEVADQIESEASCRAEELGVTLSFVTERGDVTRALTQTARGLHADLIVVGRSAKVLHHLAGSLSHRLICRRDAPVVVVVP